MPFQVVRVAYYGTFQHSCMHIDSILHLCSAYAVATHIQYIIYTARNAVEPVLITVAAIACKIHIVIRGKIIHPATLMVAIRGADD